MRRIWSSILLGVVGWIGGLKDCKKELWKKGRDLLLGYYYHCKLE